MVMNFPTASGSNHGVKLAVDLRRIVEQSLGLHHDDQKIPVQF